MRRSVLEFLVLQPRTGEWLDRPAAEGPSWTSPVLPTGGDWTGRGC